MNLKEMRSKIEKGCGKTTRYGACGTLWCGVSKVDELVWICSDCRLSLSTFNECMKAVKEMIEDECAPEGNPLKYRDRMLSQLPEVKDV